MAVYGILLPLIFDDIFEGKKLAKNCKKNPFINKKNKTIERLLRMKNSVKKSKQKKLFN